MKLKNTLKQLWKDESAQGMLEYILIASAVVAIFVIFKKQIMTQLEGLLGKVSGGIESATND